jgi:hypothetical protein
VARRRRVPTTRNGNSFGVSRMTIQRWTRDHGFAAAKLPDEHIVTSVTLIDLWLWGRLKHPAFDDAAAGSGSAAMACPAHAYGALAVRRLAGPGQPPPRSKGRASGGAVKAR